MVLIGRYLLNYHLHNVVYYKCTHTLARYSYYMSTNESKNTIKPRTMYKSVRYKVMTEGWYNNIIMLCGDNIVFESSVDVYVLIL